MKPGEAIFTTRMRRQISRKSLAERAGITVGQLGKYENCRHKPRVSMLIRIAEALGISFAELMCDAGDVVVGSGPLCRGSRNPLPTLIGGGK